MDNLKLYVWTDFCSDYTAGLAFAIASSETEARQQVATVLTREPFSWGDLEVRDLDERSAFAVYGGSG